MWRLGGLIGDGGSASPMVRQSPTALAFVIGLGLALVIPGFAILDPLAVWGSVVLMALAVGLSVLFTLTPPTTLVLSVPFLGLAAIALARIGVGPIMTPAIVLPLLWLAVQPRRRWVEWAGLASLAALMLEYVWPDRGGVTLAALASTVFTAIIFTIIAAVVNAISGDNRKKIAANKQLVRQREAALAEAVDLVGQLSANEARLESTGRLLRSVLDSVTRQSVVGTDLSGRIDVWNPGAEALLGLSAGQAERHRHIYEFHLGQELEAHARELGYPAGATVLNPGFSALVEKARLGGSDGRDWSYLRADGSAVPVHVAVTRRVDEEGEPVGYLFVGTDITEHKELARLQDEFVGLVSHELRTPISSILGYLELMRDDTDAPLSTEQRHFLGVAERNALRLLHLVGDLLFTAQVAAHQFPIEATDVDLGAIVEAAVESARPASQAANVLLLSHPAPQPPLVHGDGVRIAQACDNLVSNALKFTPRGGTVTVSVDVEGAMARVSVRDTGMGIPPDEIDRLSTRFFRASTATRSAVQGVGLGLSITKAIVTAHGGQLDVTSELGVGTTFVFTLPLSAAGGSSGAVGAAEAREEGAAEALASA